MTIARIGVLGGLLAASLGAPLDLRAADVSEPPPEAIVESRGWAGPYVGAHIGFDRLDASNTVTTGPAQSWHQDTNGWLGGVLLGYNWEFDSFVLGAEADAGFGDVRDSKDRPGLGKVTITDHGEHTFRARAGWATDLGLLYATGGLALSDIWIKSPDGRDKNFHTGFVVGGGFESKVTDSVSLRGEYLYSNYGDENFHLGPNRLKTGLDSHRVRVGVSWYFW